MMRLYSILFLALFYCGCKSNSTTTKKNEVKKNIHSVDADTIPLIYNFYVKENGSFAGERLKEFKIKHQGTWSVDSIYRSFDNFSPIIMDSLAVFYNNDESSVRIRKRNKNRSPDVFVRQWAMLASNGDTSVEKYLIELYTKIYNKNRDNVRLVKRLLFISGINYLPPSESIVKLMLPLMEKVDEGKCPDYNPKLGLNTYLSRFSSESHRILLAPYLEDWEVFTIKEDGNEFDSKCDLYRFHHNRIIDEMRRGWNEGKLQVMARADYLEWLNNMNVIDLEKN